MGPTWRVAAHQRIIPAFDRVDIAVDGLSSSVDMIGSKECRRSEAGARCGNSQIFAEGVSRMA